MRRRAVEVEVALLDVLAVVALGAGEAEEPLLQDRIAPVPQREREADVLVAIADAGEAVLVPAVGARAGVIVRKVVPGVAVGAVVLAHRAPGALAEVRPPALPVSTTLRGLVQAAGFGVHRRRCIRAHAAPEAPPPAAPAPAAPPPLDPPEETNHAKDAAASDGSSVMDANHGGTAAGRRLR